MTKIGQELIESLTGALAHAKGAKSGVRVQTMEVPVVRAMDRTPAGVAASMHECFEGVDTIGIMPSIRAPVLLLGGDKSEISLAQTKLFTDAPPNGRAEMFAGYGHGVNLLLPEQCARTALAFWKSAA